MCSPTYNILVAFTRFIDTIFYNIITWDDIQNYWRDLEIYIGIAGITEKQIDNIN